ncbi:MAG: macro domain-containing protein [Gemmatimonadetes bacterium]|nr:macro domain-containing protein [Gemmatimonadota bacterium]
MTSIRIRRGRLGDAATEAVLRPVRSDLAAVTAAGREVGLDAGADVVERLAGLGEVPVGGAVVTPGGKLAAAFLIHVVVQAPDQPMTETTVRRALVNGLRRAREWGIASLALPPLGAGAGSLEPERWARLVVGVLREHGSEGGDPREVEIVVETPYEEELFEGEVRAGDAPDEEGRQKTGES